VGNVQEQELNPDAHVVYVDYEPVAAAHAHRILDRTDRRRVRTNIVQADLRNPSDILDAANVRDLLDFNRPVGLLIVATLHFASPEDRPGSCSPATAPHSRPAPTSRCPISRWMAYRTSCASRVRHWKSSTRAPRTRDISAIGGIRGAFRGFDLVETGVVWAPQWHLDETEYPGPASTATLVGVGRKS
jgi:hypothetical protein